MRTNFPLLVNDEKFYGVFEHVLKDMPEECESYIVGGAMRNAIYRRCHQAELQQRDYDQIVIAGYDAYVRFLGSLGFYRGGIDREDQLVMAYDLVPNANPTGYDDSVVFDMHPMEGTDPATILKQKANFTINGFALSIRDLYSPDWQSKVIALPTAFDDIEAKRLRLNPADTVADPADMFACLRFMSVGFTPPPKDEIARLLKALKDLPTDRFARNLPKLFRYVGGKANARKLIGELGIKGDLLDETEVKSGKVTI